MTNKKDVGGKKDIVIDTNVIRLYDKPKDKRFLAFFKWLREKGTLGVSKKLIAEYGGTGNRLIFVLINELQKKGRYDLIPNKKIKEFKKDKNFNYTCNNKDIYHARLVFLSKRKLLVGFDTKLVNDINRFKKVDGVKPKACKKPSPGFYE